MATNSRLLAAIESKDVTSVRAILQEGCNLWIIPAKVKHPLQLAVELGCFDIVSLLLQYKISINTPITSSYQSALHCAVLTGNTRIIEETLKLGGDWNALDDNNSTPLNLLFEQSVKLIERKMSKSPNEQKKVINILKVFLKSRMDVNTKLPTGETLLYLSIKHDMQEVAEFLLTRDADLNVIDNAGNTLAHIMVKNEIERQLLRLSEMSVSNKRQRRSNTISPFAPFPSFALKMEAESKTEKIERRRKTRKDTDFLEKLLSKGVNANIENKAFQLPLHLAMQYQLLPMIPVLIRYTKNLQITNNGTILHKVLEIQEKKIERPISSLVFDSDDEDIPGSFEPRKDFQIATIVKLLLSRGLSVDAVDNNGNTPLILASKFHKFDIVMDLLKHTTNVNYRDNTGNTALHYIVNEYHQRTLDVIRAIVAKGADLKILNNEGLTPVQVAARYKHKIALHYFKEIDADFKQLTSNGDTLLHLMAKEVQHFDISNNIIELIMNQDCKINAINNDGLTPLFVALQHVNFGVLEAMIRKGANVNFRHWSTGWTPLHVAVQSNCTDDIQKMFAASRNSNVDVTRSSRVCVSNLGKIVQTLLRAGAKVDVEDNYGLSPLYYSVKFNNADVMALLLEYGADLNDLSGFSNKIEELVKHNSVIKYLVKLRVAKLSTSMFDKYSINLEELNKQSRILTSKCTDEIMRMKQAGSRSSSLYYFIRKMSIKKRIALTKSNAFTSYVSSSQLENDFPFYRDIILGKYYEAVEAKSLRERAANAFIKLTGCTMLRDNVEQIISNLNNVSLRRMITAAESKKRTMTPLLSGETRRPRLE